MMVRTQISLAEAQHETITRLALLDLAREHPLPGAAEVGVHHDDHLADGGSSLVDQLSFVVLRDEDVSTAFAFDEGFARAGFTTVP